MLPGHPQHLRHPGHHSPLGAALPGNFQITGVGENGLIPAAEFLQQPGLNREQHLPLLVKQRLHPRGGQLPHRALGVAAAHLSHMGKGDLVGPADIDILPVVDLQGQRGKSLHQLPQIQGGRLGQGGLFQQPVRLKIVDRRPVGQHRRSVYGDQRGVGLKGAVGPAGGHGKVPALPGKIADGLQIAPRNGHAPIEQRIVKVAGQQQTVKFSHRDLLTYQAVLIRTCPAATFSGPAGRRRW